MHTKAIVRGVTPESQGDISAVWDFVETAQKHVDKKQASRAAQVIELPNEPIGIAWVSDLHLGNGHTNYKAIRDDTKLIASTDGMYAIFHGDATDNWIVGKLQALQRGQAVSKKMEDKLFVDWVHTIKHKLLAWCSGNHDEWTTKLAGWEPAKEILKDLNVLYDPYQIHFTLKHGNTNRSVLVRHKWKGGSIYNPTHSIETGWERGDIPFDIGVGGHTHIGTYCRPFHKHGKRRYAILTGTYKTHDVFGEEIGFPKPKDVGCGLMVILPNQENIMFFENLAQGALFLKYARAQHTPPQPAKGTKRGLVASNPANWKKPAGGYPTGGGLTKKPSIPKPTGKLPTGGGLTIKKPSKPPTRGRK
jgi:hypothetical protein